MLLLICRTDEGDSPKTPIEEEPKEMTLDEWKNLQRNERKAPEYKLRKANEGDKGFPKNAKSLRKPTEEEQENEGSLYFPKRVCGSYLC